MKLLIIALGFILTILFFLNIKSAADILCRIAGGFAILLLYNSLAPSLPFTAVGINAVSAFICGICGIPGGLLLVALNLFI